MHLVKGRSSSRGVASDREAAAAAACRIVVRRGSWRRGLEERARCQLEGRTVVEARGFEVVEREGTRMMQSAFEARPG